MTVMTEDGWKSIQMFAHEKKQVVLDWVRKLKTYSRLQQQVVCERDMNLPCSVINDCCVLCISSIETKIYYNHWLPWLIYTNNQNFKTLNLIAGGGCGPKSNFYGYKNHQKTRLESIGPRRDFGRTRIS